LAKKLKKKIEEMCGLVSLDWEARQQRANQILASTEWKQKLCNELIGLSFRELEQILSGIATERQKKEENDDKRQKSLRGDSIESGSRLKSHAVPRTLRQILAQVYAPRVDEIQFGVFRREVSHHKTLSDSDDGDDSTKE
jgi:hypothetical protein